MLSSWLKQAKHFDEHLLGGPNINKTMVHYPCGVCENSIDDSKQSPTFCDILKFWVHSKCNHLNFIDFQHIKACTEP